LEARPIPTWSRATADSRRQIIALLLERGALSRADLARLTHLNKPTISNLVARLIDEGIVQEIGSGSSTGGRKPILLSIQETSRLAVGVEIDASVCRFLLVTLHGERLVTLDAPRETSSIE
jgi:DNA-binding Lrp family transcriptional regulator